RRIRYPQRLADSGEGGRRFIRSPRRRRRAAWGHLDPEKFGRLSAGEILVRESSSIGHEPTGCRKGKCISPDHGCALMIAAHPAPQALVYPNGRGDERSKLKRAFCSSLSEL